MDASDLTPLQKALGHQFQRIDVLEQAVTHSSYARESQSRSDGAGEFRDNEQLEFLGDAVLGFVTSRELCRQFPEFREGQLSKLRAYLVSEKHLIRVARGLKLGTHLRLGRGEEKSGGREKPAMLVDALEAVLAALYLDAGLEEAERFILRKILHPEFRRMKRAGPDV